MKEGRAVTALGDDRGLGNPRWLPMAKPRLAGPPGTPASPGVTRSLRGLQTGVPASVDLLGVEPGRVGGSLARLLALRATVAPNELAGRLAGLPLGVDIGAMGI